MKIIDLLNKIANGEEVPKRIRYKGNCWYLEQEFSNRLPYYKNGYNMDNLLTGEEKDYFSHSLNNEVEILEEEKKVPEKLDYCEEHLFDNNVASYLTMEERRLLDSNFKELGNKINSIIDYLKSKGDE